MARKRKDTRNLVPGKRRGRPAIAADDNGAAGVAEGDVGTVVAKGDHDTSVAESDIDTTLEGRAVGSEASAEVTASKLAPGLHVTASPIGNLGDITGRARHVLAHADLVLCEDTRVTGRLLHLLGMKRPLLAYHDHNGEALRPGIIERLRRGCSIVLVSDAGTPCIADPGFKLVRDARAAGISVFAVPGASSLTAALSIAGLATDRFLFSGFLPARQRERRALLQSLSTVEATLVFLESPARLVASLGDCAEILGPREAAICRELTKLHEEVRSASLTELAGQFAGAPAPRGEIVLLIEAARKDLAEPPDEAEVERALREALAENKPGRAAAIVAQKTGLTREDLYKRALALRSRGSDAT